MKKKMLSMLLAAGMILSLAACGGTTQKDTSASKTTGDVTAADSTAQS